MKKKGKVLFSITEEQWEQFVSNSCIREEVGSMDNHFMAGYQKGIQVALLDLLAEVDLAVKLRADVSEIEHRVIDLHKELRGVQEE